MSLLQNTLAAVGAASALIVTSAAAQGPRAAAPVIPLENEPAPELFVEPPLPEPLAARGVAVIPYRTEHFRILPVFGSGAVDVSPRTGHLHVTVDDLPWHWADAGGVPTVIVADLPAGPHKVLIELATPDHRVLVARSVSFTVPPHAAH